MPRLYLKMHRHPSLVIIVKVDRDQAYQRVQSTQSCLDFHCGRALGPY